ncbi:HIT/MYND zinc finger-like protein [Apiospora phragmitis]|uniref:HIT/MYND zinc finger-like protein n=1 Tax=Apiospora phragmitis TaxID=2905665 RepID=A0ABR1VUF3_9PEZI
MPDFTDPAVFPAFYELPSDAEIAAAPPEGMNAASWWMLAQVKVNMTLTKPTLIVTDRRGLDFAVTFEDPAMDLKGYKKGYTLVVPRAQADGPGGGQEGGHAGGGAILQVGTGELKKVIPAKMEHLLELGQVLDIMRGDEAEGKEQKCGACGKTEASLSKCTGCGTVKYCSKECQLKGWSELGHKSNCKSLKAIKTIWPS